jgi:prevent-host-death family protein
MAHPEVAVLSITTITSREFNQDAGGAKKAAENGPVVITDRGRPAHVLLSFDDYQKLLGNGLSLFDALAMTGGEDIEFDPPKMELTTQQVDFDD